MSRILLPFAHPAFERSRVSPRRGGGRAVRGDRDSCLGVARQRIADLERALRSDLTEEEERDAGWDTEALRRDVLSRGAGTPLGGGSTDEKR